MKTFHMISGLPRSGSTLLSSILNQNPRFSAGISNPLNEVMTNAILAFSLTGNKTQMDKEQRINVLSHIIDGYYEKDSAEVVFNTSRNWTAFLPMMDLVRPEAKVICCVRDIFWVLDSFEVLRTKDPTLHFFNNDQSESFTKNNVYTRTNAIFEKGPLQIALDCLKQGFYSEYNSKLHFVEYNDLASNPEKTMQGVYNFIGEPYFIHDFDNVERAYDEYDISIGQEGTHTVRKKVELINRPATLPQDLYDRYANKGYEFWR